MKEEKTRPTGLNGVVLEVGTPHPKYGNANVKIEVRHGIMQVSAIDTWVPYVRKGKEIVISDEKDPHILWMQS